MRVAPPIDLTPEQQEALEQCARARSLSVRLVERVRQLASRAHLEPRIRRAVLYSISDNFLVYLTPAPAYILGALSDASPSHCPVPPPEGELYRRVPHKVPVSFNWRCDRALF